jgi:AcrR family transcriptional regulator
MKDIIWRTSLRTVALESAAMSDVSSPEDRSPAARKVSKRSLETRARIMTAAEEVFARDGVAHASMAAVLREAGQRNDSAVLYHFGSRLMLAVEIIELRRQPYMAMRLELIERATAGGAQPTLHEAIQLLVRPTAAALETREGRNYLRINADIFHRLPMADRLWPRASDLRLVMELIGAHLEHLPDAIASERLVFAISALVEACALRATDIERQTDPILDAGTWERNVVMMLEGLLVAPAP